MLNETHKHRKHFHPAWLLLIIIPAYVIAGFASQDLAWPQTLSLFVWTTFWIAVLCSIPLGIAYGLQDKEFWL